MEHGANRQTSNFSGKPKLLALCAMPFAPSTKPCLILIMGVAGSGKSTLSREILRHVRAVYLDNNHIADVFFPYTRNGPRYEKLRRGFYRALYTIAEENLKLGNSVLLDVPHIKEVQKARWRTFIRGLARRTKAKMAVVRCRCSEKTLRTRIKARGEPRDIWKLGNWEKFLKKQPIDVSIPFPHLDIDTEKSSAKNIHTAIRYIRKAQRAKSREQRARRRQVND
jgi:predicted kinase